jgi:hypothetical protein
MKQSDFANWIYVAALLLILVSYVGLRIPYALRYFRRKNWPSTNATVQNFTTGAVNRGKNWIVPARFVGYAFKIQEQRFCGYFVVLGKEGALEDVRKNLQGRSLQIRYDPSDPTTSLLVDYKDARFGGLLASQDPEWLDQAPAFDLQDALRGQSSQ